MMRGLWIEKLNYCNLEVLETFVEPCYIGIGNLT